MQTNETAEAADNLSGEQRVRFLSATFRHILLVVLLIFIFAVVQMLTLWQVCQSGMKTATSLEHQGLPALNELASLQENLALYRLESYEYLFAQEAEKAGEAKAADGIALQMRAELQNIQTLFPEGEGRQLAANLENAIDDLATQFQKVRSLVNSDFPAAMKSMDQDIPPRTRRVDAAAAALKKFGYQFSGGQASATFASFGWIKTTAVMFGTANSFVVFCAILFVLLAARRSRAQLSETLARLDERTMEVANSQSLYHSLVDQMPAGVFRKDAEGRYVFVNSWFCRIKGATPEQLLGKTTKELAASELPGQSAKHPEEIQFMILGASHHELIMKNGRQIEVEEEYPDVDGKMTHLQVVKSAVFGPDGKIIGTQGMLFDITDRKQAEVELAYERDLLRSLLDSSPDQIYFKDLKSRFIKSSRAQAVNFGLQSAAEMVGKTDFDFFADERARPAFEDEQEIIRTGHPLVGRVEKEVWKDGRVTWVLTNKIPLRNKDGQVIGTFGISKDITELKRAEETMRLLGSAVEQSKESIVITDAEINLPGPKIIFVNPAFTQMTGYTAAEAIGKTPRILQGPLTDKSVLSRLRQNLEHGETFAGEAINYRKDGKEFNMEWQIAPLRDVGGKITHFVAVQHDITGRKRLEAQLFQSQKLETVGKLAGGFAHEFNSILTAIIGQSELLLGDLPAGSPLVKNTTEINKAAARAATLTRQLLAYGRKQFLQPESLDLNRVIAGMESMFHHLLGVDVDTQIIPAPDLRAVKVDAGQIEQVIMNLVINARDAMPNGGKLMLETANVSFDTESVGRYPELKPGDYVMLAISDTGTGMSEAVKARVFEPFFSTKGVGQGTGLGLSTCYGIVKQSGGHISIYSELGRGTTFKIYLPQIEAPAKIPVQRLDAPDLPHGTETILLVEDDPALREMAATLLRRLGYIILSAANGVEALSLKHQRGTGHIDLLFTDVVMPHMSGKELADRVRALYPHTKILFTSAYTENAIVHQGVLDKGVALLQKPFTPSALAKKVREVLD
jgi:two-component system, cell cycle sensor histidine kinase and response regulator CckA